MARHIEQSRPGALGKEGRERQRGIKRRMLGKLSACSQDKILLNPETASLTWNGLLTHSHLLTP